MTADLDAELEQATRQAFARMFGVIEVTPPEEMPDMTATTLVPLDADGSHGHRPHRRRNRNVVLAAAACAAVAAAVAAVIVVPDRSSPDRVSTTTPSSTAPATTSSTAPTTSSTSLPASTVPDTTAGTGGQMGEPRDDWPASGEVRAAERRGLLDPATSDVPLDRLADVVELRSALWPVVLQAADDGNEVALQLVVTGDPAYGAGIEGTPHQLQTHWMVDAVDNQFVVWGLVPSDIASVTISTRGGQPVAGDTVPVGPVALQSRAFAVILPQLAYVDGASGERADGTISLAAVELEASLVQFQQHSPHLREWTGFIPVVQH